jgi:hypothetical protein
MKVLNGYALAEAEILRQSRYHSHYWLKVQT